MKVRRSPLWPAIVCSVLPLIALACSPSRAAADGDAAAQPDSRQNVMQSPKVPLINGQTQRVVNGRVETIKYDLRYKFKPGEKVRCKVLHQGQVRTTIDGTSQTAATVSASIKLWKILAVDAKGNITFVHSVEHVDMKNDVTGREAVHYDSRTDKQPPPGFENVAKRVGVPLTIVTMDDRGNVIKREDQAPAGAGQEGLLTLPLADHPVAVGESWTLPNDIRVRLHGGMTKLIHARQRLTLAEVEDGIARIKIEMQILTPVHDPEIEAQLVESETEGTVRFDIAAGRVVAQQIDLDRSVVGYPNEKSSMHVRTRFTEQILGAEERTAEKSADTGPKK